MAKKKVLPSVIGSGQGAPIDPSLFPPSAETPGNVLGQMGVPVAPVTQAATPVDTESLLKQMINPAETDAVAPEAASLLARAKGLIPDFAYGGKKAAGKGAGLAIAADVAAPFAGKAAGSLFGDQVGTDVRDALAGAGTLGGIGSIFGLGLPGALVGALGGGIYGQFFDHPKSGDSVGDRIMQHLTAFGVDPNLAQRVTNQYNTLAKTDKAAADSWLAGQVGEAQSQFTQKSDLIGGRAGAMSPEQNLVLQQLAGQAMAPYVNDMRHNLDASASALKMSMGKNLTPEQSMRMAPLVTQYANLSKNVADAYALQAEQFPIENQLAKSAWATAQAASSGGGGGLTNLLAQTTPSVPNANAYSATT